MITHNICFRREIRKILCGYPLLSVAMVEVLIPNPLTGVMSCAVSLPTCNFIFPWVHWGSGGCGFNHLRVRQHSFLEIDHEIFSSHSLPSAESRKTVVSFWQKNVHKY